MVFIAEDFERVGGILGALEYRLDQAKCNWQAIVGKCRDQENGHAF